MENSEMRREGRRPRALAKQLGVAPNVIYEAVAKGEFGPVWRFGETGRAIVIPEAAVQAWLASKASTDVHADLAA